MKWKLVMCVLLPVACVAQSRPDLYECEGCEAILERAVSTMKSTAVVAAAGEPGERLVLSGRVFKPDGKTPAPGVVVYMYHTDAAGVYSPRPGDSGWGRRHGHLRAWVITSDSGTYRFETIRPAPYPGRSDPAHIHMIVKESNRREYWINDVVFTDDPNVKAAYRHDRDPRGGSGIVTPERNGQGWTTRRNIILER